LLIATDSYVRAMESPLSRGDRIQILAPSVSEQLGNTKTRRVVPSRKPNRYVDAILFGFQEFQMDCSRSVVGLVISSGMSFNMDGTIYICTRFLYLVYLP
jgi:hypothetical protein